MKPDCRTISLAQLAITPTGPAQPLCDSCYAVDCENPIEERDVSVFGKTETHNLYIRNEEPRMVIECEGYTTKEELEKPKKPWD